jgi:hypothetical protein
VTSCVLISEEKYMPKFRNVKGERFGNLTALAHEGAGYWSCLCDCGNTCRVRVGSLTSGNTRSCGCLRRKNPGRPRLFASFAQVPPDIFFVRHEPQLEEMRNTLREYGVEIGVDCSVWSSGTKLGPFDNLVHAIAAAMLHGVKKAAAPKPKAQELERLHALQEQVERALEEHAGRTFDTRGDRQRTLRKLLEQKTYVTHALRVQEEYVKRETEDE